MIIDKKKDTFVVAIFATYFIGEVIHSYWNEFNLPDFSKLFWYANRSFFLFSLSFIFSYYIINRRIKAIVKGGSFLLLTIGLFQCFKIITDISIHKSIWIIICSIFILLTLLKSKYVSSKIYEK